MHKRRVSYFRFNLSFCPKKYNHFRKKPRDSLLSKNLQSGFLTQWAQLFETPKSAFFCFRDSKIGLFCFQDSKMLATKIPRLLYPFVEQNLRPKRKKFLTFTLRKNLPNKSKSANSCSLREPKRKIGYLDDLWVWIIVSNETILATFSSLEIFLTFKKFVIFARP